MYVLITLFQYILSALEFNVEKRSDNDASRRFINSYTYFFCLGLNLFIVYN